MPTNAERLAGRFVSVSDDRHTVTLAAPGADPVEVGPFPNPAVTREKAAALRRFVAAAMTAVEGATG